MTPDSLQYVIEDLFETITLYNNTITEADYEKFSNNQFKINLTINVEKIRVDSLGIEKTIDLNDWIDIGIYSKNEEGIEQLIYLEKHKITAQEMKVEILVNEKPTKVGIDPTFKLIDRNLNDNIIIEPKEKIKN